MMNNSCFQSSFLIFFICFVTANSLTAQIKLLPVEHPQSNNHDIQAKTLQIDTLTLPFWDDFSTTISGKASSSLWANSDNVFINNGLGLAAPSSMVATFDGVDAQGIRYSSNDTNIGIGDSLSSQAINLRVLPFVERPSVFLSFFWQKKGNGDIPEREDFLELLFLDANGEWISQWKKTGQDDGPTETFEQAIIPIIGSDFFTKAFVSNFRLRVA